MPQGSHDHALLMMAHGSRDTEAREEYRRIHAAVAARVAPTPVVFSVLEFPDDETLPSIEEGWRRCLATGATQIAALPFFLFLAGHVREDLPAELKEARAAGGWADLNLLPPLGAPEELLDALEARALEASGDMTGPESALVLVGAGTSDPDANGDLCKAARLLWERANDRFFLVETAWVSLTRPTVAEAVDRCVRLGAKQILLAPYFLNTGVLLKRIDARIEELQPQYPSVPLVRGNHLGLQPRLLDLLERRAREGFESCCEDGGVVAVCGRPSCTSLVAGRASLRGTAAPVG